MGPATPISRAPTFGGQASSFLDYEPGAISRNGSAEISPERRSALLILHMGPAARQVCVFSGADVLMEGCGATLVAQASRDYFQPDAADRVFAQAARFQSYVRAGHTIGKFLMGFGIFRRKVEDHMFPIGGGFPDIYICLLRIKAAQLKPREKTLLMASLGGQIDFARLSKQLRQLFQPTNSAAKEAILRVTTESTQPQIEDLSYEAWLAYKNGNQQRTGSKGIPRAPSKPRTKKGGRGKKGCNRRIGERNRCYRRGSEYHLLPKCPMKQDKPAPAPSVVPPSLPRSAFSTITLEDTPSEPKSVEHFLTTCLKADRPISYAKDESVAILDTGAAANLVCPQWLRRHNELLARRGFPQVPTYQAEPEKFATLLISPRARPGLRACSRPPFRTRISPRY